jgi:hypothetical protein
MKEAKMLAEIRRWLAAGYTIKATDVSKDTIVFQEDGSCATNLTITAPDAPAFAFTTDAA